MVEIVRDRPIGGYRWSCASKRRTRKWFPGFCPKSRSSLNSSWPWHLVRFNKTTSWHELRVTTRVALTEFYSLVNHKFWFSDNSQFVLQNSFMIHNSVNSQPSRSFLPPDAGQQKVCGVLNKALSRFCALTMRQLHKWNRFSAEVFHWKKRFSDCSAIHADEQTMVIS